MNENMDTIQQREEESAVVPDDSDLAQAAEATPAEEGKNNEEWFTLKWVGT